MPSWVSSSPDTGRRLLGVAAALVLALSLGACSAGPGATAPTLSGAWVRPPQGMELPGAGYLVITCSSDSSAMWRLARRRFAEWEPCSSIPRRATRPEP